HLQGGRKVSGTLRGYDLFLNLVIDDALEESTPAQKHPIGMVVRSSMTLAGSSRLFTTIIYLHNCFFAFCICATTCKKVPGDELVYLLLITGRHQLY
ncbi:hypothetical protein DFH29DRAFT_805207, partial [Suillus ampliporus]